MRFTKEHSKLKNTFFTTIRKNTGYYRLGRTYTIVTPSERFKARVQSAKPIRKADISDSLALVDADISAENLRKMLERWYGKKYDDFVLMRLVRRK